MFLTRFHKEMSEEEKLASETYYLKSNMLVKMINTIRLKCRLPENLIKSKTIDFAFNHNKHEVFVEVHNYFACVNLICGKWIDEPALLERFLLVLAKKERTNEDKIFLADTLLENLYKSLDDDNILREASAIGHKPSILFLFHKKMDNNPHWEKLCDQFTHMMELGYTENELLTTKLHHKIIDTVEGARKNDFAAIRVLREHYKFSKINDRFTFWNLLMAENGDHEAILTICRRLLKKNKSLRDQRKDLEWHLKAAEMGEADEMYICGRIYLDTDFNQPFDAGKGLYFLKKAANNGHVNAAMELSRIYSKGVKVTLDTEEAKFWEKKAFENKRV